MQKGSYVPKTIPGVGWVICKATWLLRPTVTICTLYHTGNYLELLGEPNSITTTHLITLELLREQKFNYKCILKCVKLRWVFFIVYQKRDLVKQPMQKGSFVPKIIPRVGGMVVDIIVQNTTRNIPV